MKLSPDNYKIERKKRLADLVSEYLNEDDTTPQEFYDELIEEVDSWIDYHKKQMNRAVDVKSLLMGYKKLDIDLSDLPTGISTHNISLATQDDYDDFWNY